MAIPPVSSSATTSPASPTARTDTDATGSGRPVVDGDLQQQRKAARAEQNLAILEASQSASISAGSEPLTLVFRAAIDAINKELEPLLGENALERGQQQGLDVSPEATADRIVSLTTGLFSLFRQQRPEFTETEQVERFLEVIGGGIDQGFSEAREILDGLGVLEGEIASNIDRTYELVQQGLQAFRERFIPVDAGIAEIASEGSDQAPGT